MWAVFLGRHSGKAFVDDMQNPRECLVRTDALLTYASRGLRQEFLERAIEHYRRFDRIWLVRNQGDSPAPTGYKLVPRLEFYDYDPLSKTLADFRNQLPPGTTLRTIDMDLLQRCEWRDDMAFYCGSLENFLRHGLGVCLMQGENILCEAYASAFGASYAEIGALTHEPYRGKGLAPITVSHLIDLLEKKGYHAYWSCDKDNPASARVARKLGFTVERPYEIFDYEPVQ
ncbi:MAG TPA: GNAT family N-acetyltransferase [Anaerolineales bacterium]|nr:GNAT family N-acetyltransferase [Anaerolineales bacterium]